LIIAGICRGALCRRFEGRFWYLFKPGWENRGILTQNQDFGIFLRISVTVFALLFLYY